MVRTEKNTFKKMQYAKKQLIKKGYKSFTYHFRSKSNDWSVVGKTNNFIGIFWNIKGSTSWDFYTQKTGY
jgi:hypothetical protein